MKTTLALLFALGAAAYAGPRASANYSIATDTTASGGGRTASASYTHDGHAGPVAGISTVAAPVLSAKHGFAGQITDATGLQLTAGNLQVGEGATLQLAAWLALDDDTFHAVPGASLAWNPLDGPITIGSTGLITGGPVFQNTAATAQGTHLGFAATLGLTVLDTITDNFGTYAADGIGDDWQVQYFGHDNPQAAPGVDASGNGHTNRFKYIAGLDPLDPADRFTLKIEPVSGQPGQMRVIFSPLVPGRSYMVKAKSSLTSGTFTPLGNATFSDHGDERTVTDLGASGVTKYYHVEISKP